MDSNERYVKYRKNRIKRFKAVIIFMMFIRTMLLILSGAIFWPGDVASNSLAAWSASIIYNLPYSIGTYII